MRARRMIASVAAAALAAVTLAGCATGAGSASGSDAKVVAFSYAGTNIVIWNDVIEVMKKELAAQGYELLTDDPQWKAQQQVADWEAWLQRGDVKAIMGFPIQPEALVPVTAKATAAGVPVLSYATNWDGAQPGLLFDSPTDGRILGENACEWITANTKPGQVRTVGLLGDGSIPILSNRVEGMKEGLATCGSLVKVVDLSRDGSTIQDGNDVARSQLQADPNTTVWLTAGDDLGKGVYQALIDSGVSENDPNVFVGAVDGTQASLELVKKGGIFRVAYVATAEQIAEANMTVLLQAARGETVTPITMKFTKVTTDNVAEYLN